MAALFIILSELSMHSQPKLLLERPFDFYWRVERGSFRRHMLHSLGQCPDFLLSRSVYKNVNYISENGEL